MKLLQELRTALNQKSVVRNVFFCLAIILLMHLLYGVYRNTTDLQEGKKGTNNKCKGKRHSKGCAKSKCKGKDRKRFAVVSTKKGKKKRWKCQGCPSGKVVQKVGRKIKCVQKPPPKDTCENATMALVEWNGRATGVKVDIKLGDCVKFKTDVSYTFKDHPIEISAELSETFVRMDEEITSYNFKPQTTGTYNFKCTEHPMNGIITVTQD